jgi:pimeloyl-ACP methyl ester carboxylesterase
MLESLVQGKELMHLSWFYNNLAYNPAVITQTDINDFVSHYSSSGGMRDGFIYFRAFPQDAVQKVNYSKTNLTRPVLVVGAGYIQSFGGNVTINYAFYGIHALAQNVRGIQVLNSGHWISEERPDFVIKLLDNFFGGSTANAIK